MFPCRRVAVTFEWVQGVTMQPIDHLVGRRQHARGAPGRVERSPWLSTLQLARSPTGYRVENEAPQRQFHFAHPVLRK